MGRRGVAPRTHLRPHMDTLSRLNHDRGPSAARDLGRVDDDYVLSVSDEHVDVVCSIWLDQTRSQHETIEDLRGKYFISHLQCCSCFSVCSNRGQVR